MFTKKKVPSRLGGCELFERAVGRVAAVQGVPVAQVRLMPKMADTAAATSGKGGLVSYGPELGDHTPAFVEWCAAHEVAHVSLGHGRFGAHQPTIGIGLAMTITGLSGFVVSVAVTLFIAPGAWPSWTPLLGYALGAAGVMFTLLTMLPRKRGFEIAADRLAAEWGYPLTPAIAAELDEAEGPRLRRTPGWMRSHPRPADRIAQAGK